MIGVLEDSLPFLRQLIETELNSANDNPLIDADGERILHGGHFTAATSRWRWTP